MLTGPNPSVTSTERRFKRQQFEPLLGSTHIVDAGGSTQGVGSAWKRVVVNSSSTSARLASRTMAGVWRRDSLES